MGTHFTPYPPRYTTVQRDLLNAFNGQVIYNTTTGQLESYNGAAWVATGKVYGDATFIPLSQKAAASGVASLNASSKVVQDPATAYLPLAGGTMAGALDMDSQQLQNAVLGTDLNLNGKGFTNSYEAMRDFLKQAVDIRGLPRDFVAVQTGSGSSATSQGIQYITSGATAGATALRRLSELFLGYGLNYNYVPWNKKIALLVGIQGVNGDSAGFLRYAPQLKEVNTYGELGEAGIGITWENQALYGKSYATGLSTVDLSTTLANAIGHWFLILHDPTVPSVTFYVDGVSKGSITTSANIPQAAGSTTGFLMFGVGNTGDDSTNQIYTSQTLLWVEAL